MLPELIAWATGRKVYRDVYERGNGPIVLADLRRFTGAATKDVYCAPDGRVFLALDHPHFAPGSEAERRGMNLGRLQVYERIQKFVRLSDETIAAADRDMREQLGG